jgi:PIN domain nuclease of toxin-antitoxin system
MQLLLDTHTFLWLYHEKDKLSRHAAIILNDSNNQFYISHASVWEISIKVGLGKLMLPKPLIDLLAYAESDGFSLLPIKLAHLLHVQGLPRFADHRDPFDRLIVSQAIVEQFGILSADSKLDGYNVNRLW